MPRKTEFEITVAPEDGAILVTMFHQTAVNPESKALFHAPGRVLTLRLTNDEVLSLAGIQDADAAAIAACDKITAVVMLGPEKFEMSELPLVVMK